MISKFTKAFRNGNGGKDGSSTNDNPALREGQTLDKKLLYRLRRKKIPSLRQFKHLPKILNGRERVTLLLLLGIIVVSVASFGVGFYLKNFIPLPAEGGEYTEGLIGAPQYINPLLSQTNDVDTDLSRLLFSGLVRYDSNLQLVPDLAEGWEISDDLQEFTFRLKPNLVWHDGEALTADDVIFTIQSIQDADFKSPLLVSLRGVEAEKIDELTVTFSLPDSFPEFLEVLTLGILPEHIWREITPINANLTEYNLKPVGSGPWQFKSLTKDRLGNIKTISLVTNPNHPSQPPFLEKLTFKFYPDFATAISALKNRSIDGISFLPKELKDDIAGQQYLHLYSFPLPQFTSIFFNQKENEFIKDKQVRKALALAINKPSILTEALQLEGEIIDGPILPGSVGYDPNLDKTNFDPDDANDILDEAGWERITPQAYEEFLQAKLDEEQAENEENEKEPKNKNKDNEEIKNDQPQESATPDQEDEKDKEITEENFDPQPVQTFFRQKDDQILELTLTTVAQPENTTAAELVKEFWQTIGVKVNLEIIEGSKISREIIKPRDYELLLYGAIVGPDSDPYPFWHSSQSQDPGLNLAVFANRNVDKLLEEARTTLNDEERHAKLQEFQQIILNELPAIFLYSPSYTYVVDEKVKGVGVDRVLVPADRFNNLADWYIKTKRRYISK